MIELNQIVEELDNTPARQREQKIRHMLAGSPDEQAAARFYLQHERRRHHESPHDKSVRAPQTKG